MMPNRPTVGSTMMDTRPPGSRSRALPDESFLNIVIVAVSAGARINSGSVPRGRSREEDQEHIVNGPCLFRDSG